MAEFQAWFIALLSISPHPYLVHFIGSSVCVLIFLAIVGGVLTGIQEYFMWWWNVGLLWIIMAVLWILYMIFAAVMLFGNWGGVSVFGLS